MALHPFSWIGALALPRLTLLLNHVLSSEPAATAKLQPHAGRTIDLRWTSDFTPPLPRLLNPVPEGSPWVPPPLRFVITPAGLLEAVEAQADTPLPPADGLTLTVHLSAPLTLARQALRGERPDVQIEGDAALAEAASWLMKHLRWDIQDDVARLLGNAPAELLRNLGDGIRQALQRWRPGPDTHRGAGPGGFTPR